MDMIKDGPRPRPTLSHDTFDSLPSFPVFCDLEKAAYDSILGRGENAGNQNFLRFPQWFLLYLGQIPYHSHL